MGSVVASRLGTRRLDSTSRAGAFSVDGPELDSTAAVEFRTAVGDDEVAGAPADDEEFLLTEAHDCERRLLTGVLLLLSRCFAIASKCEEEEEVEGDLCG